MNLHPALVCGPGGGFSFKGCSRNVVGLEQNQSSVQYHCQPTFSHGRIVFNRLVCRISWPIVEEVCDVMNEIVELA